MVRLSPATGVQFHACGDALLLEGQELIYIDETIIIVAVLDSSCQDILLPYT